MRIEHVVEQMRNAGCTPEQIGTVTIGLTEKNLRSGAAIRQARYRAKRNGSVTVTHNGDVTNHNESPILEPSRARAGVHDCLEEEVKNNIPQTPCLPIAKPKRDTAERDRKIELFLAAYSETANRCGLSPYRALTSRREAQIVARCEDFVGPLGFPTLEAGLAEYFKKIREGPHLLGNNDRGWKADLDFVINESSCVKIMEGRYAKNSKPNGFSNGSYHAR